MKLCPVHPEPNLSIKFVDGTNLSSKSRVDSSVMEVNNIEIKLDVRMTVNMSKTKEMLVYGRQSRPVPPLLSTIARGSI